MPTLAPRYKIFLWVAAITFALDQITKIMARAWLEFDGRYGKPAVIIENFFDFRLSFNPGSAFGLFSSLGGGRFWLTLIGIGAIVAIVWMLKQARDDQRRFAVALGLVAGGAFGNVLDRILFAKVTDFVVWKWYEHEWPTFNVADAALVVGVGLLFLDIGRDPDKGKEAGEPAGAGSSSSGGGGGGGGGDAGGKRKRKPG